MKTKILCQLIIVKPKPYRNNSISPGRRRIIPISKHNSVSPLRNKNFSRIGNDKQNPGDILSISKDQVSLKQNASNANNKAIPRLNDQKEEVKNLTNTNSKPLNSENTQVSAPNLSDAKQTESANAEQVIDESERPWKSPSRKKRK